MLGVGGCCKVEFEEGRSICLFLKVWPELLGVRVPWNVMNTARGMRATHGSSVGQVLRPLSFTDKETEAQRGSLTCLSVI